MTAVLLPTVTTVTMISNGDLAELTITDQLKQVHVVKFNWCWVSVPQKVSLNLGKIWSWIPILHDSNQERKIYLGTSFSWKFLGSNFCLHSPRRESKYFYGFQSLSYPFLNLLIPHRLKQTLNNRHIASKLHFQYI
jgi:hypothetical protein